MVSGLIPYAKYYLPDAKVAVCLLSNRATSQQEDALLEIIKQAASQKNCLVVASIDFSITSSGGSAAHDRQTQAAIEQLDYRAISEMDDANLDSPQALTVIFAVRDGARRGRGRSAGPQQFRPDFVPAATTRRSGRNTTYFIYGAISTKD